MKKIQILALSLVVVTLLPSCSDDDAPAIVNEEEVITTVTATLTPSGGGTPVVLTSRDLDGDGPDAPVVTVSAPFTAGTAYSGTVTFLNELESPAGNITEEIEEEGTEHQLFFVQNGALGNFTYADADANGNPVGLQFNYTAATAPASTTLTIVLRHQPDKTAQGVSGGTITNAGGSTDAQVIFPVVVAVP